MHSDAKPDPVLIQEFLRISLHFNTTWATDDKRAGIKGTAPFLLKSGGV